MDSLRRAPFAGDDATLARAQLATQLSDLRSRMVGFGIFPSPLGRILIGRSEQGVALVHYLPADGSLSAHVRRLLGEDAVEDRAATEGLRAELVEYLEGRRARLDWPLDLRRMRSDFQRRVLEATAALPYGAVTSYGGIAARIGAPSAVRPVAQALRWNPLPIVIPCHRVIGGSGALTGYAGRRVELKQRLLAVGGREDGRGARTTSRWTARRCTPWSPAIRSTACPPAARSCRSRCPRSRCSARGRAPSPPASRRAPAAGPICIRSRPSRPRCRPPPFHAARSRCLTR